MQVKPDLPTCAAALAALTITSDGIIDPRELEAAEALGRQMFTGFSATIFQDLLKDVESLPPPVELAHILRDLLDKDGRIVVMEYLVALSLADERLVKIEQHTLQEIADGLETEVPSFKPYSVEDA